LTKPFATKGAFANNSLTTSGFAGPSSSNARSSIGATRSSVSTC